MLSLTAPFYPILIFFTPCQGIFVTRQQSGMHPHFDLDLQTPTLFLGGELNRDLPNLGCWITRREEKYQPS